MELTIDKEFAAFWPELADDAEEKLLANLQKDGCTDPIIIWANHDDTILDGYHRYRLCTKHKIPFKTKAITLADRVAAMQWIFDRQIGRRNVTPSQRAYSAALLVNSHVGRPNSATVAELNTVADVAEKAGVSERLVRHAGKVQEDGAKELKEAVRDGEIPAAQAAVIAELPKAEQAKVVKKGPEAVAAKVKKIKEADKPKEFKDTFDPADIEKRKPKNGSEKSSQFKESVVEGFYGQLIRALDDRWNKVGGHGVKRRLCVQKFKEAYDAYLDWRKS